MSTLDAQALDLLTDEEREAIEGSDLSADEIAGMQRLAGDSADDAGTDGDDGNDDDDGDDADDGNTAATTTPAAAPAAATDPNSAAGAPQTAAKGYEAQLPENFQDMVQDLADKEAQLKAKFRSGEIEFDDFEEQRSALTAQRETLTVARTKAEISQEMQAQTAEQVWLNTVGNFLTQTASTPGGIDYRTDAEKGADLDEFVKNLAAKPANADKPMEWFLTQADRRVRALHGLPATGAAPTPTPTPTPAPAAQGRKPPTEAAPRTLADVPGGDGPGDVGGEFADVLALDGEEYEQAIARMSQSQRDKFLRSA